MQLHAVHATQTRVDCIVVRTVVYHVPKKFWKFRLNCEWFLAGKLGWGWGMEKGGNETSERRSERERLV